MIPESDPLVKVIDSSVKGFQYYTIGMDDESELQAVKDCIDALQKAREILTGKVIGQ